MPVEDSNSKHARSLRERAEAKSDLTSDDLSSYTSLEMSELVHELRTHQIELDMQNEELRNAQILLADSRDRYLDLYDFAPIGYVTLSQKGLIIESNLTFARMLGVFRTDLDTKPLSNFILPADQDIYYEHHKSVLTSKPPKVCQIRFLRQGAESIWCELESIQVETNGGETHQRTVITDITQRRLTEQKLLDLDNLRELLLDIMTHDLKNSAGVIYGMSELALSKTPEDKLIDSIYQSSARLIEVLNNTSTLAQATFGEQIPTISLDLNEIFVEVCADFSSQLKMKEIDLSIDIPKNTRIHANPIIKEIFKNYISNAIKYGKDGKKILIETIREDQALVVCVKDLGEAIAVADRLRIFDRHTQLSNSIAGGRGLGLAIVKRIAMAHNAEVWIEPNSPQGNRFCLRLPLHEKK